jgi:hypothetical protein
LQQHRRLRRQRRHRPEPSSDLQAAQVHRFHRPHNQRQTLSNTSLQDSKQIYAWFGFPNDEGPGHIRSGRSMMVISTASGKRTSIFAIKQKLSIHPATMQHNKKGGLAAAANPPEPSTVNRIG